MNEDEWDSIDILGIEWDNTWNDHWNTDLGYIYPPVTTKVAGKFASSI
jgi:hypothetical protein